ncbi:MAG TPA: HK97 family phage prohead protease [Terracidiphilus sp.]|jgi:HK97 family phage prohead protease|nr:HK97 family phage prohead protease [Terracidiphilus sp.]
MNNGYAEGGYIWVPAAIPLPAITPRPLGEREFWDRLQLGVKAGLAVRQKILLEILAAQAALEQKDSSEQLACTFRLERKSDETPMHFVGYASTPHVDAENESICIGAFRKTLAEYGDSRPFLWHHQAGDCIGLAYGLRQTIDGLEGQFQLTPGVRKAEECARLIASRAATGLSVGFAGAKRRKPADASFVEITELDLWEISLTAMPSNRRARLRVN